MNFLCRNNEIKMINQIYELYIVKNMVALRRRQITDTLKGNHHVSSINQENRLLFLGEQLIRKLWAHH